MGEIVQILASRPAVHDETLIYYVSPSGEIQLAPDNRITDPAKVGRKGWHSFEARTAKEKEDVAARMAEQLWQKKKDMQVQQHMREAHKRNELRASARLRLCNPKSKLDALCNQKIIDRLDEDEQKFFKLLSDEFDPTKRTSGLEIEWKEAAIGFASRGEKRAGLNG